MATGAPGTKDQPLTVVIPEHKADEPVQKGSAGRPFWSGTITIGLVNVPVRLHTMVRDRSFSFRLLHREDGQPLRYDRVCTKDGRVIPWADTVKGYEVQKGRYVVFEPDELKAVMPESDRKIRIQKFVYYLSLDPTFFETPYILVPDRSEEAYSLAVPRGDGRRKTVSAERTEIEVGGRTLSLETGRMARQAGGAVVVRQGDTVVLVTACMSREPKKDISFLPLTVDYREGMYAAGKIPGGFLKREGRPNEKETLSSRLIDRPIRPLFPHGWNHETQVIAFVLSADKENNPDVLAVTGASAALALSEIPFTRDIAGVRVGMGLTLC